MAKIFLIRDERQNGDWDQLPWLQCVAAFALDPSSGTEAPPPKPETLKRYPGFPDRIVVRLEEPEAGQHSLKPAFFLSPMDGLAAKFQLDRLNPDHVARLEAARRPTK